MNPERWQQVKEILDRALQKDPAERSAFVGQACLTDPSLKREVESLLASRSGVAEDFLKSAPPDHAWVANGTRFGSYEIVGLIAAGGMGEVYRARDQILGRDVAIKVLPSSLAQGPEQFRRFEQKARAAAALNHPNILAIHQMGTHGGAPYLVMELLEGSTLREQLMKGRLQARKAVDYSVQVARGLLAAHEKGVVHRDLKPENLFVTKDERLKILDFGLAKLTQKQVRPDPSAPTVGTESGIVMGTVGYMSPEQVRGQPADHRADIFAFGAILYEALTGERAFRKPTSMETMGAILNEDPPGVSVLAPGVPVALQKIVVRCLEKNQERRFQSASDLAFALEALSDSGGSSSALLSEPSSHSRMASRTYALLTALALVAILGLFFTWYVRRTGQINWARDTAIPEIVRLVDKGEGGAAFALAKKVEAIVPGDQAMQKLWSQVSLEISVHSEPQGADVYMKPYGAADAPWEHMGRSPISHLRVPFGLLRWRAEKQGFQTAEMLASSYSLHNVSQLYPFGGTTLNLSLTGSETIPNGMVRIPGGEIHLQFPGISKAVSDVDLPDYWIDRYEMTNREFKKFVDAGAYRKSEYWKQPFVENGTTLSWEKAMLRFRDKAGRPGPATWELGNYPEGEGDYPVTGVSWYEAAAYAEFAGKSLPTAHQWQNAAWPWLGVASYIAPISNFDGKGLAPIGSHQGMSPYGTYDMAGNAKEWCWNATTDKRFILGGAWNEPRYMFLDRDAQSPFDRLPTYGFRLVKEIPGTSLPRAALGRISFKSRDLSKEKPVSDQVFAAFKNLYRYDTAPLDTVADPVEESSEYWTRQKVTFNAAYGNERMSAYVYLPKDSKPPYETVVFFPGEGVVQRSSKNLELFGCEFIVKSGRALVYPIYKSHYERGDGLQYDDPDETARYRDHVIYWAKDLGRAIDYLETRKDLNLERLAYYGLSTGAYLGNIFPAVESRIRVTILLGAGFEFAKKMPEVDELNFAPRIKVPTLLVNGRYDEYFPLETSQNVMFRLLGTPERDKRHAILEGGHIPPFDQTEKEILDWLDKYQGPVK